MPPMRVMYGPAPTRPRKTNIVRSRSGCKPCRRRRKKCDERQPCCSRCEDSGTECCYDDAFEFRDANQWAALQVKKVRGDRLDIQSASTRRQELGLSEINRPSNPGSERRRPRSARELLLSMPSSPEPQVLPVEVLPISPFLDRADAAELYAYESPTACGPRSGSASCGQGYLFGPPDWDPRGSSKAAIPQRGSGQHDGYPLPAARCGSIPPTSDLSSPPSLLDGTAWDSSSQGANPYMHTRQRRPSWQRSWAARRLAERYLPTSLVPGLSCPGISVADHRYLSHFVRHVVDIIPANKDTMLSFISGSGLALQAAMAIGAANLANLQGRYSRRFQASDEYLWTPDRCHQVNALDCAGKALSMATSHRAAGIGTLIASHLMLSLVEVELGTFEGLRRYLASADGLVCESHEQLLENDQGREMLRSLANTRSMQRFISGPVGPQSRESPMDLFWQTLESRLSLGSYHVQKISYSVSATMERLSLLTTMRHVRAAPAHLTNIVARHLQSFMNCGHIIRDGMGATEADLDAACLECFAEMRSLSDAILSLAPPEGIPHLGDADEMRHGAGPPYGESGGLAGDVEPLRFESHEEAMCAADYVFCRIMREQSVIQGIVDPSGKSEARDDACALRWLTLLVRIALGLDPADCVNRNIYRRGICGMLLHSAIRCLSPRACGILKELLDRLILKGCVWEDTTFPSVLSVSTVRAVREQLEKGRSILFMSTVKQDFDATFTIMSNRMTRTLIIHGWEADGGIFDARLPLNDFVAAIGR